MTMAVEPKSETFALFSAEKPVFPAARSVSGALSREQGGQGGSDPAALSFQASTPLPEVHVDCEAEAVNSG